MKGVVPVLAAGGTFALTALAGLTGGVWISRSTGSGFWVAAGLFAGMALGGYAAMRLLLRSM